MAAWNENDTASHQNEASATGTAHGNINDYGGITQRARGLHIQVPPLAISGAPIARLLSADEVVMNDGVRAASWSNLQASMATSGAGGYLGGVNNANWYRLVALRRGTEGTVSGVANGTKSFALAQDGSYINDTGASHSTGDDTTASLRVGTTTNIKLGQGFQVSTAAPVMYGFRIKIRRDGSMTGNVWLTIETNASGLPSGTVVATSDKLDAASIPVDGSAVGVWAYFVFRTPPTLASGTQYHLVLQGDYAVSGTNWIGWKYDATAATYTNGSKSTYNGTTWTAQATEDFMFEGIKKDTQVNIAANLPAGYDQYAVLGWAYYNGSQLTAFTQQDREVLPLAEQTLGSSTATLPTLTDLSAVLPPVPVDVELALACSAAGMVGVAGVPYGSALSLLGNRAGGGQAGYVAVGTTSQYTGPPISFHTEQQRIYTVVATGTGVWSLSRYRIP